MFGFLVVLLKIEMRPKKHNITQQKKQQRADLVLVGILVSVLFVYLLLRSILVPVTHDEAATFFHYVHLGKLFPPITREEANNHYLNTLLTFVSYHLLGSGKWVLRLPNLLGSILFFYYLYRISKFFSSRFFSLTFFLCVSFSLYFLDFFALSRGYGLSMAFLTASIFYTIQPLRGNHGFHFLYSSLFILLMLAANLSTLVPAIALFLIHLFAFSYKRSIRKSALFFTLLIDVLILVFATFLLLKLKSAGSLYLGTPGGGLLTTLKSWLFLFTGGASTTKLIILFVLVLFLLFSTVYHAIKCPKTYFQSAGFVFDFLLWASLFGSYLATWLFKVNYPEGRVGLYFFPIFMGSLFFSAGTFPYEKWRRLFVLPALFFPVYFLLHFNFSYAQAYKTEVLPKRFYTKLAADTTAGMPTLAGYHMESTIWDYYNFEHSGVCNTIDWSNFPETEQDYQLFNMDLFPEILRYYKPIDYEPISHLSLLKRKQPVKRKRWQAIAVKKTKGAENRPFINLFVQKTNLKNRHYLFDVRLSLFSKEQPLHVWLVLQATNQKGKSNIYKFIPLDCLKDRWDGSPNNFKQSFLSGKIPPHTKILKLYLWNMDRHYFRINGGKVIVSETFPDNQEN